VSDESTFFNLKSVWFRFLEFTVAGDRWPVKSIAWLMVQIWFGNTYLSFTEAESFHPVFGPILMVFFAALSNSLLLTILISILSNTFARINEHASQEFLFQHSIATLEGAKADAVFSYRPPFNIAAYVILNILSWVISPRALHTVNVFMIRVMSFPILLAIACYERYIVPGRGLIQSSKGAASALYDRIPKGIKKVALFDAFTGSRSKSLLGAVLKAEYEGDRAFGEHLNINETRDERGRHPPSPTSPRGRQTVNEGRSRSRRREMNGLLDVPESPLARSFTQRRRPLDDLSCVVPNSATSSDGGRGDLVAMVQRIENLLMGRDPAGILDQMKGLGEQQARIEALLLGLTGRGA